LGVYKAYSTRVGAGPLPTELVDATGNLLRERGREYGTTTGRPRRIGWFDAVAARYVARLSGITEIAVTLLDVLDVFDEIKVCTAYHLNEVTIDHLPASDDLMAQVTPVYDTLPGWRQETTQARTLADLPPNALAYIRFLETKIGVPITRVGVGPGREQIVPLGGA
jgi:adenylosuccinate synthase